MNWARHESGYGEGVHKYVNFMVNLIGLIGWSELETEPSTGQI